MAAGAVDSGQQQHWSEMMRPIPSLALILPVTVGLAACAPYPPPQTTQVIMRQPQPAVVAVAPMATPPPEAELVPPPPVSSVPTVWQPGHWRYTGDPVEQWAWQPGQYVAMPTGAHTWVPGQWQAQNGSFVWQEGHWG
jgi:hypothetical protein